MLDEKKRQETLALVSTLYNLAVDLEVKMRVQDSLLECKKLLQEDGAGENWNQIARQLEEAINFMEQQISGKDTSVVVNDVEVSKEEIKQKILELWTKGENTGAQLKEFYRKSQIQMNEKLRRDMADWTNVAANYEMMSMPERFVEKCAFTGQDYDRQMEELGQKYLDEVCGEYAQAMNRIKSLLTTLGPDVLNVRTREIYEKWDAQSEVNREKFRRQIAEQEKCGNVIADFGRGHVPEMNRIIQKYKRKRKFYVCLPLLVVLILLVVLVVGVAIFIWNASKKLEEESGINIGEAVELWQNISGLGLGGEAAAAGGAGFIGIGIPILIIIVVAYVLWIQFMNSRYRRWLIKALGDYLRPHVEAFWQENVLESMGEQYFNEIGQGLKDGNNALFASLFEADFGTEEENGWSVQLQHIKRQWKQIQYMEG